MPFYTKGSKLISSRVKLNTNSINKNIIPNHINVSTSNRLFGKDYSTDRYVYSSQNPYGNFVRNPNCWLNGISNISCFSPAQLSGANWWQRGGTLITRKHALFAKHFVTSVISGGTPLVFIDDNNNKYQPKIINYAYDSTDIAIALLDSEVNSNIKIAKVLPTNFQNYFNTKNVISVYNTSFGSTVYGFQNNPYLYAVGLDQEEKAIVFLYNGCRLLASGSSPNTIYYQLTNASNSYDDVPTELRNNTYYNSMYPNPAQFSNWNESIVTGDSGNPLFLIIDNELVVISAYLVPTGGPFITNRYNEVNALIESLSPGEGYSLSPVDLATVYAKYS